MLERVKKFASGGLIGEARLREIPGLQPNLSPLGDLNCGREDINKAGSGTGPAGPQFLRVKA